MEDFIFDIEDVVFEASQYRSEYLKYIDEDFAKLKQNIKSTTVINSLVKHIEAFTGINNVVFSVKSDYDNAFVVPKYNKIISFDLIQIFKDFQAGKKLRRLETVEEPTKYIDKIYIIFGKKLINNFSPRELTAILLHELGHSFIHTSNMPLILIGLLRKVFITIGFIPKVILLPLIGLAWIHAFILTAACFIVCRSLTFLEHRGEYKADQFAAKYGYGDEIIRVLYKLHGVKQNEESKKSWLKKVLNYLIKIFIPSTHPKETERILQVSDEMLSEYKKMYPKLSKELTIILSDIKSEA